MARYILSGKKKMETRNTYQLLIDYDFKIPLFKNFQLWLFERKLKKTLKLLSKECYIDLDRISRIESFHGYHLYIWIQTDHNLKPEHLLTIQTLLGDDKYRVIFNLNRMLLGWSWKNNNILFKENEK